MSDKDYYNRAVDGLLAKAWAMTLLDKFQRQRIVAENSRDRYELVEYGAEISRVIFGPDFLRLIYLYADAFLAVSHLADELPVTGWDELLGVCPVCNHALVPISVRYCPDVFYCEFCLAELNRIRAMIDWSN